MKSRLASAALAVAFTLALPAGAALAQSAAFDQPPGYTEDGRLKVFGARIDPQAGGLFDGTTGALDDVTRGTIGNRAVNGPAAGYGIPAY